MDGKPRASDDALEKRSPRRSILGRKEYGMQAFLITAYKDFDSLKELTVALSRHGLCFVHADRRGTITAAQIDELNAMPNVRAIRKRKVNWGSIEHLYAMLDLCRMALEDERTTYLHLMSAQDYPTLSGKEMENRFDGETRLFIQRTRTADHPELAHRYEHYHFMHLLNYRDPSDWAQNWVGRIDRWQDMLHVRRKLSVPYKGLLYVSLPRDAAEFVLKDKNARRFLRQLRTTYIPEEFFFQNVFNETPFEARIVNRQLHFSIWDEPKRGLPAVLNGGDLERIDASGCCFARKIEGSGELAKTLLERWDS